MQERICRWVRVMAMVSVAVPMTVSAQETEQELSLYTDLYIDASKRADFETFHLNRNARLAAADVTFGFVSAVSDRGTYRFVRNGFPDMAAFDIRAAQMSRVAPPRPETLPLGEAIERLESSIRRQRSELGYVPANPRITPDEYGFFRELSFYLRGGADTQAVDVIRRFRALYEAHEIEMGYSVNSLVVGAGANYRVIFFARDAGDFYGAIDEAIDKMGEEYQSLVAELYALCKRTESTNWTIRRDLNYQPAN